MLRMSSLLHQTSPHRFLRKQLSVAAVTSQCGTGKRKDKRIDGAKFHKQTQPDGQTLPESDAVRERGVFSEGIKLRHAVSVGLSVSVGLTLKLTDGLSEDDTEGRLCVLRDQRFFSSDIQKHWY